MSRVVHFEIHADDPQRAINFYTAVFGWTFRKWEGPQEYWLIETGPDSEPGINGGLIKRRGIINGGAVIAYVCTIDVTSVDEAISSVEKNGGSVVVPKMPVRGVGWLVYFKDTEGNVFGALQSDEMRGSLSI